MENIRGWSAVRPQGDYSVSLPPGPRGLDVGLAILDLLEDRFGAELIDFDLGDRGGHFTVRFPTAVRPARPGNAA